MMIIKTWFIGLVTLCSIFKWIDCVAEIYTSNSFDLISSSSYPHFVMFYAPWCGHCKRVRALWDSYAEENQKTKKLKVAKVDCSESASLCARQDIKAYPTFRLYNQNKKYSFRGKRNIPSLKNFVTQNLGQLQSGLVPDKADIQENENTNSKTSTTPIKATVLTTDTFSRETEQDFTFVDFYAPWCPHCVQLEPVWDKLATHFQHKSKITIAKVDCTSDPELCRSQDISAYPSLKLFQNGHVVTQYQNARSLAALIEFVEMALSESVHNVKEPHEIHEIEDEILIDGSEEEFEHFVEQVEHINGEMLNNNAKDRAHLIYFHNGWFHTSHEYLHLFDDLYKELQLVDDFPKPNAKLAIINCNADHEYCEKLQITSFPLIRFYKNQEEYTDYHGRYEVKAVAVFLYDMEDILNSKHDKVEL